jgi:hypothetical protein
LLLRHVPHETIGNGKESTWDTPGFADFVDHRDGQRALATEDFGCACARPDDLGEFGLAPAHISDRIFQDLDWIGGGNRPTFPFVGVN